MSKLVVIASNPPTTPGTRTRGRVELARQVLGFELVELTNLFPLASFRTGEIAELGAEADPWLAARPGLETSIAEADAVLLAYGVSAPSGPARGHFREQAAWVDLTLARHDVPTWWVGGRPTHPSRWHRHTHRVMPEVEFEGSSPFGWGSWGESAGG